MLQKKQADGNVEDSNESNDGYDDDDKATRLTLMEQILLLGLKDREVCFLLCLSGILYGHVINKKYKSTGNYGLEDAFMG